MEYIKAKTILSGYSEGNAWFGANYNMNIYKGCSHGCIYCDSRSECYNIQDFDTVKVKENAVEILAMELRKRRKKGVVGMGAMSDPYNPLEKKLELTRKALQQIDLNGFGISITSKSDLMARDIDIFKRIKKHSPHIIKFTITTHDDDLCSKIEERVSLTSERFKALEKISSEGLFTGVLLMPILPFINDTRENIVNIIRETHGRGGKFISTMGIGVTLRANQREHYYQMLRKNFPEKNITRKYREVYGNNYECSSIESKRLWYDFKNECEKLGLLYRMDNIRESYKKNYKDEQLSFF